MRCADIVGFLIRRCYSEIIMISHVLRVAKIDTVEFGFIAMF